MLIDPSRGVVYTPTNCRVSLQIGMFRRTRDRLERIEAAQASLAASLAELAKALAGGTQQGNQDGGASSAITALGALVEGMAGALARSQESNLKLTDGLLNRAARQVTTSVAREMAAKSHESRKRNQMRAKISEGLPAFVEKCEVCTARLQQRHQVHWNDDARHQLEQHDEKLHLLNGGEQLELHN